MEKLNHEYYISLEVAKLLKEAGFDWECYELYEQGSRTHAVTSANWNVSSKYYSAPTLDVAQRWLREAKKCCVSVVADCDSVGVFYTTRIIYYDTNNNYYATYVWDETKLEHVKHRKIFNDYEEAQEEGIKKALELILEKG